MTASTIRSASDCTRFLETLGYDTTLAPISRDAWPDGLPVPSGRWWYGGSFGSLDLHVIETTGSDDGEPTLRALTGWNAVRSHALIQVTPESSRILLARYGRRTASLKLHPRPRSEDLDRRLGILRRSAAENRDPAELFGRALESDSTGRRFFEKFRRCVDDVATSVRDHTRAPRADCDDEALLILCRLLFLRFVERKGWLDGDGHFLRSHIESSTRDGIWRGFLEPLFFGCLNQPVSRRKGRAAHLGRIPYLNGGLFERSNFERRFSGLDIADAPLRAAFDGLFDVFEFSVSEETEEVTSIDPEMLGRVFESLMESDERAASGSFYTPPAIVDRIVAEALADRLGETSRERDDLLALMNGARSTMNRRRAEEIASAARELRILDPACGTGAFLLSTLHRLESIARGLGAPDLSRRFIVENQLYGIDRKPEAIRLCELRLWLAVVASESCDWRDVQPLPNLDRNIAQGDTLISPVDFSERVGIAKTFSRMGDPPPILAEYRRSSGLERARYRRLLARHERDRALKLIDIAVEAIDAEPEQATFAERRAAERPARRRDLLRLKRRLERGDQPFFDWRITFCEVAARDGFDLVVGNPPWVRHSRIDPDVRKLLLRRYDWFEGASHGFRQADLFIAFLQRSLQLCRPGGMTAMLVPAKLLTASYAAVARREIVGRMQLRALWKASGDSFDADTFPLHLRVSNASPADALRMDSDDAVDSSLVAGSVAGGPWLLAPDRVSRAIRRLELQFPLLATTIKPRMGLKTGDNELFVRNDLIPQDDGTWRIGRLRLPAGSVVRLMRGRDLRGGKWGDGALMLWPPKLATLDRSILERLAQYLGTKVERLFRMESNVGDTDHLVAWKDLALRFAPAILPATLDGTGGRLRSIPNQTLYYINTESHPHAAALEMLLGTTPVAACALAYADVAKDRHRRYMGATIGAIPFPPREHWMPFADELARLRERSAAGDVQARTRVDRIAANLFRLSVGEMRALRLWMEAELGQ